MSSTSILSSRRQRILIAVIIIFVSPVFISLIGFPEALLFFCGASTGAILTIEFRYNNDEISGSGDEKGEPFEPVSTGEKIKRTLLSPQVGKYMFIGIVAITLLVGGAVLFGGGIPFVGSGAGGAISGTVYDDSGETVSGATIALTNQKGVIAQTTTASDGSYLLNTTGTTGPYTVRYVSEYEQKEVEDGETANFNEPGFISNLPIIGNNDAGDDELSTDVESSGDSETSVDVESSDESSGDGESISFVEGKVVSSEDGEGIKFANVTALNQDGEEIPSTRNETTLDGSYRVENIPPEAFGGDITEGTLRLKAEKEGFIETGNGNNIIEIDLSIRDTSTGIEAGTDIEVNET